MVMIKILISIVSDLMCTVRLFTTFFLLYFQNNPWKQRLVHWCLLHLWDYSLSVYPCYHVEWILRSSVMILSFADKWASTYLIREIVRENMVHKLGILIWILSTCQYSQPWFIVHIWQNIPGGFPWIWTVGESEKSERDL